MKKTALSFYLCLLSFTGYAQNTSTNIQVTAQVNAVCEVAVTNLSFGVINGNPSQEVRSNFNITAKCSNGAIYRILLPTPAESNTTRHMYLNGQTNSDEKLAFYICLPDYTCSTQNSNHVWRSSGVDNFITGTGNGTPFVHTVGAVTSKSYSTAGQYSGNQQVSIEF